MKKVLFIIALSLFTLNQSQAQTSKTMKQELKHVVFFKFKPTSTKASIDGVVKAFNHLYGTIPEVKNLEWGLNISTEQLDQGFTHCFSLTFSSAKDLAAYQIHPAHSAFKTLLPPVMEKAFVVDYFVTPK